MLDLRIGIIWILPLLLQLIGLTFAVSVDPYIRKRHRQIMLIVVALILSLIARDYLGYLLDVKGTMPRERTLLAIYGYSARPVLLALLCCIVRTEQRTWPLWLPVGINAAIHLTALFSGVCFSIDGANQFHRGPLGFSCHIVSGLLLIQLAYLTLREIRGVRKTEMWIPVFNVLLIVVAVVADMLVDYRLYPVTFLTIAVVSGNLFYYIWLHLQFVREHEEALKAEQRIRIMMTQIQPHFLYNTIATFKALCRIDPEKAAELAEKFGAYLRRNLDSLGVTGRIPFQKELEHTRLYADIEMVRFENVRVEYDVADDDFTVPPLTLQPMVENAIRHGVRIREEGIVRVITRRTPHRHEIIIHDNGAGFDTRTIEASDDGHIGIRNVRERVESMCGGSLRIDSEIGVGTTVTICIPAEEATR